MMKQSRETKWMYIKNQKASQVCLLCVIDHLVGSHTWRRQET
jgi:hypothetical protein